MAQLTQRRSENTPGDFYVDSSCIDCDTCRWMAPETFSRVGSMSAVTTQPETPQLRQQAMQALLSCPTASIGTLDKPREIRQVQQQFPLAIDPIEATGIYHCGYHSKKSYGAASYFIQRPEGNILVDSPRFSPPLVRQLEALGGVRYLYLTHRDDVADHEKFQAHFSQPHPQWNPSGQTCERILHIDDISSDTKSVEIQPSGNDVINLAPDLQIIPVPGHTLGHTVLLYQEKYLFTGDHLAWSARLGQLIGFNRFCWYDWNVQIASMERLTQYHFEWVLPGHGRRHHASKEEMHKQLEQCLSWMSDVA